MADALISAFDGDVRVVADVPAAFTELIREAEPRSIALSGGATAQRCYERLAATRPDWRDVEVTFGDERWVDVDDPESNEGMARRALLDVARAARVHSVRAAGADPESAAVAMDTFLRAAAPIEVVHLGLGPDGHTASLFPGSAALAERERLVVAVRDSLHPCERITFTYPALARAALVVFTVQGQTKREALARVLRGGDVPAAHVAARHVIWLVDSAAAGGGTAGDVA